MGRGFRNFIGYKGPGRRVGAFNRVHNIEDRRHPIIAPIIAPIIKSISVHNRALLLVDTSFETRYLPLLRHLIDVGYIPNSIDIKIVKDNIVDVEAELTVYYNNGGRLFLAHKSHLYLLDCVHGLKNIVIQYILTMVLKSG